MKEYPVLRHLRRFLLGRWWIALLRSVSSLCHRGSQPLPATWQGLATKPIVRGLSILLVLLLFYPALYAQQATLSQKMSSMGLKSVTAADSTILVDLIYTRSDNFTDQVLYEDLDEAYLHPHALAGLLKAQKALKDLYPRYSLIVYDAARPMQVQQQMWRVVRGTTLRKYVSNPANGGGLHNYGLAVDVSIVDEEGVPLAMGTEVDHLGEESHITHEADLLREGKLTKKEADNRLLLRRVMRSGGFRALPSEWWHFNWCSRQEARENYQLIP